MAHLPGLAASALTLTLQWTDSERSRDSWSRTTTIRVTADEVTYAEDVRGSIRRHAGPVRATVPLSDALRQRLIEVVQAHDLTTDHTITGETGGPYSSLSVHLTVQLGEARGVTTVEAGPEGSAPPEMTMTPAERIAAFKEASDAPPKRTTTVHDDPVVEGCSALLSAVRRVAKAGP